MQEIKYTEQEVLEKLAALGDVTDQQKKEIVCALVGHSRIVTGCFSYIYCGRCGAQVGDLLTSGYLDAPNCVLIGHNCPTCRENYAKMGWRDKLMAPDPFTEGVGDEKV